ncbi:branched-chain amino acid ABC transporter permease [Rhodopila sp.]|uniref:branched-chain amino acid ABC transporter permease n=1 Tax=Rhodopila sp. TaxID=2480087 RepID=UPI002C107030|nr:branched-chain amino acid ABC transporter permease [Rhodopila sp.]HVZ09371.1 branched-chain amino acid ABC transporter permease [Rhodopila sp.]
MKLSWLIPVLVVVVAIWPTAMFSDYHLFQLTMAAVYGIAILGLALLIGFNGQISLGHGAFYAIGAYTTAILMTSWNLPYWATLPFSAAVCALVGFLVGLPALRLGGLYLALTTFALAVAVPQILKYKLVDQWTGGVQGLVIDKPEAPFGLALSPDQWLYLFTLAVAVVLYLVAWNLTRGRIGRAMMAIRDHSLAAETMGVNLAMLKTRTFAVSAMYTGLAGSLGAIAVQFVAPDSFGVFVSIFLFVGLVVGGAASIGGTLIGAAFVEFIPNLADSVSKAAPGAVYGVLLIATMFLLPAGAGGAIAALWRRLTRRRELKIDAALEGPQGLPHEHHELFTVSPAEADLDREKQF